MADLPTRRDFDDFGDWPGRDVVSPDGEHLGAVELIFLDEATGTPEWVLVRVDDAAAFVPLLGATVEERTIRVGHERDRVQAAPQVEVGDTLSIGDEKRLYEHYGLDYSRAESETLLPEGADGEQEERPRLRKYIGAPVAAPASAEGAEGAEPPPAAAAQPAAEATPPDTAAQPAPDATPPDTAAQPAPDATPAAEATPADTADRMAPRNLSSATPSPLPPAPPQTIPPAGGFQAQQPEESGPRRRLGISVALGGALAALIAILAIRRARRS